MSKPNSLHRSLALRALWLCMAAGLGAVALSGCAPMIVGGAVVATGLSVLDRRTTGTQLDDEGIETRAMSRLKEQLGDRAHVNVVSYNRQVLLTGEVLSEQDRQLAERVIAGLPNVRSIINELAVLGPSTLTQQSSDVGVTMRVKTSMIDSRDLNAHVVKVVTERGVVYLMGRVTQREADRATDIARRTTGVQKVVRLFELISEEERLTLDNPGRTRSAQPAY
ncbi:transporter [Hylemonella gracilis str. Niagara R]|uniref:Transporter n=1 Tax=Hylemonella gracilis str. Niagara R TaxID=1458275 RepID=A0A016XFN5_9BURK|nr:transporter [Hylemonella gracilis str. Niagara R]